MTVSDLDARTMAHFSFCAILSCPHLVLLSIQALACKFTYFSTSRRSLSSTPTEQGPQWGPVRDFTSPRSLVLYRVHGERRRACARCL
jgi:hypothetical protein